MRLFFLLAGTFVLAASASALRLTPLPPVQNWAAEGPALDREALVDLSLVLSGTPSDVLPAYRSVIDRWSADFSASTPPADPAKRAEALLFFLHKRMKTYSTYQTRVDVLVDRGSFNCVSSALVFMILGRDAGLDVQAVATSDHAFALVRLPGGREVDVETTTPYGFDPGTKTEFTNSFGQTGFAYVPPGHYSQRRTITDRQLLGLLVQNRMGDFQRAGRPEDAVGPAIDRWVLEGSPEAKVSLVDGFRNYAAWLNVRREFTKGLDLVDQMVVWTGPAAEAKDLAWTFLNNQVGALLDKGDWAGAQAVTLAWKNRGFLTEPQVAQITAIIQDQRLTLSVRGKAPGVAVGEVDSAYQQGAVTAARRQELLTYIHGQEVQRIAAARGALAAWTYLGTLPAEVQAFPVLAKARETFAYNWSVEVHNRFAQLWNDGKKDQARTLLQEALRTLPESALLQKDWASSR